MVEKWVGVLVDQMVHQKVDTKEFHLVVQRVVLKVDQWVVCLGRMRVHSTAVQSAEKMAELRVAQKDYQ